MRLVGSAAELFLFSKHEAPTIAHISARVRTHILSCDRLFERKSILKKENFSQGMNFRNDLVDALPYIDGGYDEPGVREAVSSI